jgi:hypothetical protein
MSEGLDGRQRDENGQIRRKRGDTLMGTLAETYPELGRFPERAELDDVLRSQGADSLSDLLRGLRNG